MRFFTRPIAGVIHFYARLYRIFTLIAQLWLDQKLAETITRSSGS